MEFEFNFGQQTLAQGIQKNEAVYASVQGVAIALSNEEFVFLNKQQGSNHVMTHQVLHALSLCQEFKQIDQHVINISQSMPELSNQPQAVAQVLDYLINNNLLIEDVKWKESISESSQQNTTKSAGIVIRTCDRPDQLKRLLDSLVKYQNKFKLKLTVQLYDDSTSEKLEKELEKLSQEYKKQINIQFYGSSWQNQFISMLKSEFSQQETVIEWLLATKNNTFTGGRVWNLALLNNAGKKFLFFDDDYVFEPRILEKESKKIDFNERPDLNVGFSLSLSDIKENSVPYEKDILSMMLNSCGQTIGNWLSTTDNEMMSLQGLNLLELQRMDANSLIKSTGSGTWGSPRSNSNYWLYFLKGSEKEEFWKSREVYLDNIEASNLMHYSENYEFLSLAKFSPSAIDNSTMTPFVMPIDRVEDHFFNCISLFCYPNQISLHYPVMMGHIQTTNRDRSSQNHIAQTPNFNKFLADYSLSLIDTTDAKDPGLRLKTLSNYVMGLADSSDKNIQNRLKEYLSQIRSDLVLSMQNQLAQSPKAPVYWLADVREIIEANGKALLQDTPPILSGWEESFTIEDCVEQARIELTQAAQAMELWPDIWEFCQTNK